MPIGMSMRVVLTDAPSEQERNAVEAGLIAYNRLQGMPNDWRPLAVLIKEGERTVGGLTGWTMWDWLFVANFFIPAAQRGHGPGPRMLRMAEEEARVRGCLGVWLDTHDWQAPGSTRSWATPGAAAWRTTRPGSGVISCISGSIEVRYDTETHGAADRHGNRYPRRGFHQGSGAGAARCTVAQRAERGGCARSAG
ncbi:MAG TPA: GNAT family N-acetyltransferase [Acetobacteraceae bacterium]|nr:GNAT family N-acetyltransferase [Acetobacteraceae bacterium]